MESQGSTSRSPSLPRSRSRSPVFNVLSRRSCWVSRPGTPFSGSSGSIKSPAVSKCYGSLVYTWNELHLFETDVRNSVSIVKADTLGMASYKLTDIEKDLDMPVTCGSTQSEEAAKVCIAKLFRDVTGIKIVANQSLSFLKNIHHLYINHRGFLILLYI